MTPAIIQAQKAKVDFTIHEYQHDPDNQAFGDEVVSQLAADANQVFKTLLVAESNTSAPIAVALVPVSHQLDVKGLAKILKVKKLGLAGAAAAQKSSGYLVGGISPLGQKKRLPTIIDNSANHFDCIYISGGKRGLQLSIKPTDLAKVLNAKFADIQHG